MSKSTADLIEMVVGGCAFGGVICYAGWSRIKTRNRIRDVARHFISSASAGAVEVQGVAWPLLKTEDCLEGKKCVYRHLKLQQYKRSGKNKKWITIWDYKMSAPFIVFDHTGFLNVKIHEHAEVELEASKIYKPNSLTLSQKQSFGKVYSGKEDIFNDRFLGFSLGTYRVTEDKISVGSPVMAHGFFKPFDHMKYYNFHEMFAEFYKKSTMYTRGKNYVRKFDSDKDGFVDRRELKVGFLRTLELCGQDGFTFLTESPEGETHRRIYGEIIHDGEHPLLLIDTFEDQFLASTSGLFNWILFMGGLLMIFFSLYSLGAHLS